MPKYIDDLLGEVEQEKEKESEKVCPIMSIGKISGFESNSQRFFKAMPKCMRERCGLWFEYELPPDLQAKGIKAGRCGLINTKQEHFDTML